MSERGAGMTAKEWNAKYPIGTNVVGKHNGAFFQGRTEDFAFPFPGLTARATVSVDWDWDYERAGRPPISPAPPVDDLMIGTLKVVGAGASKFGQVGVEVKKGAWDE